jgi:hypothetical protein
MSSSRRRQAHPATDARRPNHDPEGSRWCSAEPDVLRVNAARLKRLDRAGRRPLRAIWGCPEMRHGITLMVARTAVGRSGSDVAEPSDEVDRRLGRGCRARPHVADGHHPSSFPSSMEPPARPPGRPFTRSPTLARRCAGEGGTVRRALVTMMTALVALGLWTPSASAGDDRGRRPSVPLRRGRLVQPARHLRRRHRPESAKGVPLGHSVGPDPGQRSQRAKRQLLPRQARHAAAGTGRPVRLPLLLA